MTLMAENARILEHGIAMNLVQIHLPFAHIELVRTLMLSHIEPEFFPLPGQLLVVQHFVYDRSPTRFVGSSSGLVALENHQGHLAAGCGLEFAGPNFSLRTV